MKTKLPPLPIGVPPGSSYWNDWYEKLRNLINEAGITVAWSKVDFTGSNITSLVTRLHNTLQGLQGGAVNDYNHLTSAQIAAVNGITRISGTVVMATATATTVYTMPAGPAAYQVTINKGATTDSTSWGAYAIVLCDSTTARFAVQNNGSLNQITLSGLNIQASQSSGASAAVNFSITKIG